MYYSFGGQRYPENANIQLCPPGFHTKIALVTSQHHQPMVSSTQLRTHWHKRPCTWVQRICQIYGNGSKPWYLVNPKIAGKWMFIPLKMVSIGIDPYPYPNI